MKFTVRIIETLQKDFEVEAETCEEAKEIVKEKYLSEEESYVLTGDDWEETKFKVYEVYSERGE